MATRVCLASTTSHYTAQLWPYLNWALSLRAAGCEVVWLESLEGDVSGPEVPGGIAELRALLAPHGLGDAVAVVSGAGEPLDELAAGLVPLADAVACDVLVDLAYLPPAFAERFTRSVFVDLDPGQAQIWAAEGEIEIGGHDVHVSIGEGVEQPGRPFPGAGVRWHWLPTPVALDAWPVGAPVPAGRPWTTLTHWWDEAGIQIAGSFVSSSKEAGFAPFLGLPRLTGLPLELAIGMLEDAEEAERLRELGWSVRDAGAVAPTPEAYRAYVYGSRGEFTAGKPPYALLESGWLNDRTASYLAAGRPAVVQRTLRRDRARLPEGEGLLRFDDLEEAADALRAVEREWSRHARAARAIAEEFFDGPRVMRRLLELALATTPLP